MKAIALALAFCLFVGAAESTRRNRAMFEDNVIVPLPGNHTHRGATGSILEMRDGTLLFAYSAVEAALLSKGPGGIAARKSSDLGKTWGEPFMLQPRPGLSETLSPSLLRLKGGAVLFAYDVQNLTTDDPNAGGDQHTYVRLSSDDGVTWGEQFCASLMPGICHAMPDKVMALATGRIIMPVESPWPVGGRHFVSLCFYSDNGGYTWWPSRGVVDVGSTTEEPSVVELADRRLLMMCRTRLGYLARSYSDDQGLTWSRPELVDDLTSPCAGFHMERLPSTGDVLVIYCNNPHSPAFAKGTEKTVVRVAQLTNYPLGAARAPLSSAISRDSGKTWQHHRDITHDPEGVYGDYGYPGITFVGGGQVALVNYHAIDGIHTARIHVDWFYGR